MGWKRILFLFIILAIIIILALQHAQFIQKQEEQPEKIKVDDQRQNHFEQQQSNQDLKVEDAQLQCDDSEFNSKEIFYLKNNHGKLLEEYENDEKIKLNIPDSPTSIVTKLQSFYFDNFEIEVQSSDFRNLQCDALILSSWHFKEKLKLGDYTNEEIEEIYDLDLGLVSIIKPQKDIKFIMTIATRTVENQKYSEKEALILTRNLQQVFIEAEKLELTNLVFPVFYNGQNQDNYKQIAQIMIFEALKFYSAFPNSTLKKVIIIDKELEKALMLINVLENLDMSQINHEISQSHSWAWKQGEDFVNYDKHQNYIIDEAYKIYLKNNQLKKVKIQFPYNKTPSTHTINFKNKKIISKQNGLRMTLRQNQEKQFLIEGKKVKFQLNVFLEKMIDNNINESEIFLDQNEIIFGEEIVQLSKEFKTQAQVKFIPSNQNQYSIFNLDKIKSIQHYLINQQQQEEKSKAKLEICYYKEEEKNLIIETLNSKITKNLEQLSLLCPKESEENYIYFMDFIRKFAVKLSTSIIPGQTVIFHHFQHDRTKIFEQLDRFLPIYQNQLTNKQQKSGQTQSKLYYKEKLNFNSFEFQVIEKFLQESEYKIKIIEIYKILRFKQYNYNEQSNLFKELYSNKIKDLNQAISNERINQDCQEKLQNQDNIEANCQNFRDENRLTIKSLAYQLINQDEKEQMFKQVSFSYLSNERDIFFVKLDLNNLDPKDGFQSFQFHNDRIQEEFLYKDHAGHKKPIFEIIFQ